MRRGCILCGTVPAVKPCGLGMVLWTRRFSLVVLGNGFKRRRRVPWVLNSWLLSSGPGGGVIWRYWAMRIGLWSKLASGLMLFLQICGVIWLSEVKTVIWFVKWVGSNPLCST
ncbi:hypothetical protein RIF29_04372 [Crotalaria pallida]|uniref:Uncharacterized protein n=1 Tax=Crotalaria pallida TaxID=3830 RepID=A0AAN9P9S8_CROPI